MNTTVVMCIPPGAQRLLLRRDGKSAFSFVVNAAGVLVDGIRFNDTEFSSDWDENWDARTARTPKERARRGRGHAARF